MNPLLLARVATLTGLFGLIALLLLWQLWLSPPQLPLTLVLPLLLGPLLLPLYGVIRQRPKAHFWASMVALLYCVHGIGEAAASAQDRPLAMMEIVLSVCLYAGALAYVRLRGGVIPRRVPNER